MLLRGLSTVLLFAFSVHAQVTTATFFGIVTDSTGAVIPGANVAFRHDDTGAVTTKTTDSAGEFQFDFLRAGVYTLTIQAQGFKKLESTALELGAAQRVRQTFILEVGSVTETVEVTGQSPLVNTLSAEQRESLDTRRMLEFPVARRSFHNLLVLGTGITLGDNGGVRMNGLGRSGLKVTVDGADATSNGENPGTSMYQAFNYIHVMSVEAIQEVEVTKGVTAAEYGQQLAGSVNLVTRSGTNTWHGSLFENFRAENLNATPRRRGIKEPSNYNQFGGSLGGPIRRDRIFIFGTYEGYRERTFPIVEGDVPTASLRAEAIRAQPVYKIFLDTLYLPTRLITADTGRFLGVGRQTRLDNHGVVKGDIRLTSMTTLALTYTRGRPTRLSPEGRVQIPNGRQWEGVQERGAANFLTGGADWSSETRFGFNSNDIFRVDGFWDAGFEPGRPETVYGGRRTASLSVDGLFGSGGGSEIVNYTGPVWSIEHKYARHVGQHSFKFGGLFGRRHPSRFNIENARVDYANKADFLANIPRQVSVTFGTNEFRGRSHEFGFFAQDDWRIKSNLVINIGLRYDFFSKYVAEPTNPTAPAFLFNLDGLLDDRYNFGPFRDPLDPFENDGRVNIGPRIGFSYNPDGRSRTVIRGGVSILFAPQPWDTMANAVASSPTRPFRRAFSRTEAAQLGLRYPVYNEDVARLVAGDTSTQIADVFDPHIQTPYSQNLYLGVQRTLSSTVMIESAFVGNRGTKFRLYRRFNWPDRVTDVRRNRNLGEGNYLCSCMNTIYTSWQTSLRKRYSKNLTFAVHYTWGKALAYNGGDTGATFSGDSATRIQDFFDIRRDRGPSEGDQTHRLVTDFFYELPGTSLQSAAARHILGGWQIAGFVIARSGDWATITQSGLTSRPDYVGGNPILPNFKETGVYLNRDAFALVPLGAGRNPIRPGTIGMGAFRGPNHWNIDFSFGKTFSITEEVKVRLAAAMFNFLNYTPYSGFTSGLNSAVFGQFSSHRGERQVQLGARLSW